MVKTSVTLSGVKLSNPVIPASGTFGFGEEMHEFYDLNLLGAIAVKGTTREARYGNPTPRIAECASGMLNAVGLQNPGIDAVVEHELPRLREYYQGPVIGNVSGFSIEEYVECCRKIDSSVDIIELNVSCPNVECGGMAFGTSAANIAEVTRAVKRVVTKPLYVKLSPNVTDITEMAVAAEEGGADGICLINTLLGMRIDTMRRRTVLANRTGGFSGAAIFPVALRMVWHTAHTVKLPIIGCGGVETAADVIEMMMAGATAVEVGAANLRNPYACKEIVEGLPAEMDRLKIRDLNEIIGIIR